MAVGNTINTAPTTPTLTVRPVTQTDLPTIDAWSVGHGMGAVPAPLLPRLGWVCEQDGEPVASVFAYRDESCGMAWLAWLTSNPLARIHPRLVLGFLIDAAERSLKQDHDVRIVFTDTKSTGLANLFRSRGYLQNHVGMTQHFKLL